MMSRLSFAAVATALALGFTAVDVDAKRLGGGRSMGMQRDMPARAAPDAPAGKPATPAQGQQAQPGQQATAPAANPGAAAAPTPKRNWLGPIAGLAAGLGLAALFSHLGMGEGFASMMMILLLVMGAFLLWRMFTRNRTPQPAAAGLERNAAPGAQVAWPNAGTAAPQPDVARAPATPLASAPVEAVAVQPPVAAARPRVFVPAAFNAEGFARTAKMIFIRLQAANDRGDLDDLRAFTTPEMFAEFSVDLQERGRGTTQTTEVLDVSSEVLDVAQEGDQQIVSVRMRGTVREAAGEQPVAVDEVWHLTKGVEARDWRIAGIEQWAS